MRKPLRFVGSSLKDLRRLPEQLKDAFGSALLDAQFGEDPEGSRPFGEGLPASIRKLAEDHDGNTYRAAYTAAFPKAVYVLHVFRQKSTSGIATPRPDRELVMTRFRAAAAHYARNYNG